MVSDLHPNNTDDIRSDVFEHGYSASQDGTGYGLSIVSQIVAGHGWEISVTESSEEGVRFEIQW
ncbi:ATP-binding protein [Halorubrum amylolyticum]|uniref:ATP-binding protein n=1 Tax=Halorubrum amylolyticum TaxID=2508724 RepID=UPI001008DC97|nr:ATP-binding protein [Halorubrum amylolyticum]